MSLYVTLGRKLIPIDPQALELVLLIHQVQKIAIDAGNEPTVKLEIKDAWVIKGYLEGRLLNARGILEEISRRILYSAEPWEVGVAADLEWGLGAALNFLLWKDPGIWRRYTKVLGGSRAWMEISNDLSESRKQRFPIQNMKQCISHLSEILKRISSRLGGGEPSSVSPVLLAKVQAYLGILFSLPAEEDLYGLLQQHRPLAHYISSSTLREVIPRDFFQQGLERQAAHQLTLFEKIFGEEDRLLKRPPEWQLKLFILGSVALFGGYIATGKTVFGGSEDDEYDNLE